MCIDKKTAFVDFSKKGEEKNIVFGLTGTGYFDMPGYAQHNDGTLTDYIPTDEDLQKGFAGLPEIE